MSLMVTISGIRGLVGASLTPEVIVKYAAAYAEYCQRGRIILGRDGRITGKSIGHLVSSTLLQMGCDVTAIGVCSTPTVALAVKQSDAAGGICITASHNPIEWNGLKFFAPTGLFLDGDQNRALWSIADNQSRVYASWNRQGTHAAAPELVDAHIQNVLALRYVDVERIRKRRFRIVIDCINAAGGVIIPRLLRELGCDVVEMNCDVSGLFAHTPEPIPENLTALSRQVLDEHADLGIAVDPDVDRLVLIDERGVPIGEEYTLAAVVEFVLASEDRSAQTGVARPANHKVVINLSTTRAIDDIASRHHAELIRTPVGEINVAKKMEEVGAIIGGEGNGGVILPASHIGRDAPVGIGLILQFLAEFGGPLSALKATLPQYSITKDKVEIGTLNPDEVLQRVRESYAGKGTVTTLDGLKIDFEESWVHLRKSNTEPIIRIIAEARAKAEADDLVNAFTRQILRQ